MAVVMIIVCFAWRGAAGFLRRLDSGRVGPLLSGFRDPTVLRKLVAWNLVGATSDVTVEWSCQLT